MVDNLSGRTPSPDDALIEAIAERRKDKAFMARLAARIEADAPLMLRLSGESDCSTATLVESRQGGTLLVYECECGAKLIRTKDQAEQQAKP